MDGRERKDMKPGLTVDIVLKQDQRTVRLTRGVVKDVLTTPPITRMGLRSGWRSVRWAESKRCSRRASRGGVHAIESP
jgi:uncharacterized repeat protein (TIGR03833 family)